MVTDGAPALALAKEKGDPDVMEHPPRPKTEPIIHGPMRLGILIQTISQTGATLTAFALGLIWYLQATNAIPADVNPVSLYLSLQLDRSGRADRRNHGLCNALSVRVVPCLHLSIGAALALPDWPVFQPLPGGSGPGLHFVAGRNRFRALPQPYFQHPPAQPDRVGSGDRLGAHSGSVGRDHEVVSAA